LEGGDEISGPKMGPCDEITSPVTKLPDLKKHIKNQKGSKFLKNFFDEKVLINPALED
jgi:hypothetical protein